MDRANAALAVAVVGIVPSVYATAPTLGSAAAASAAVVAGAALLSESPVVLVAGVLTVGVYAYLYRARADKAGVPRG
jgi:ABC-type Co2+ transport system permease subunit